MARFLHVRNVNRLLRRFESSYFAEQKAIEKHAGETAKTWKFVSLLVGLPTCAFLFYKHIIHGEEPVHHEWIPYEHLRIRKVPFPWGEESLFHSKHSPGPHQSDHHAEEESKENFLTAFIRKYQEKQMVEDLKTQAESMDLCYLKMIEHIEKKKIVRLPLLPSYASLFGAPKMDFEDEISKQPVGVN